MPCTNSCETIAVHRMALITISGFPSSGKSRRALQIKAHLESRIEQSDYAGPRLKVSVLSDDDLNIDRGVYGGECRSNCVIATLLLNIFRRPTGKARSCGSVYCHAKADGTRHNPYCRRHELYQRVSLSNVLRRERTQAKSLHGAAADNCFISACD